MSYQFLDAYGSVLTADSSIISTGVLRPILGVSSVQAFNYATRNDTIASFLGIDLTQRPLISDSAGRVIIKPYAASEALVQGVGSTVNIAKASLLGLSGAGLRNYITDVLVANTGSVATLISFSDSDGSVIGRTIGPATSGSNIRLGTPMRTGSLNSQVEFTAQTATSVLHVTAFGYKAP